MIIVGLTGGIGHGKTTFANLLADQSRSAIHFESWELVAEVADALRQENSFHPSPDDVSEINRWLHVLPDIISLHTHQSIGFTTLRISPENLQNHPEHYAKLIEYLQLIAKQPALATGPIHADNKETFRPLLQWLGGYLVIKVSPGIWYDEIMRRVNVLRGSSYDLVTIGGVRYPADAERLRNNGGMILEIRRPQQPEQDHADITERDRRSIEADCVIMNDGSLQQLADCARNVYHDLSRRQLAPSYANAKAVA